MMKVILVLVPILVLNLATFGQNAYQKAAVESDGLPEIISKLHPEQDSRLTELVKWQIENNRKKSGIDGWRVEIFSSSSDAYEKAKKVKQEFLSSFPELEVHIRFIAPDFKVRVGDFRTRNEALKLRKQIQDRYPESFEVKDIIKFPELISGESEKNRNERIN
jgi:hypothetical protein